MGLVGAVFVSQAGVLKRLRKVWVDGDYRGEALKAWVADRKRTYKID